MPTPVDKYYEEVKDKNPSYSEEQAWATAWSIYCKHVNPGSKSCKKPPSEYLKGKSASDPLQDFQDVLMARRVASRFKESFKYEQKETKEHKVERISKKIRDATGLSKGVSEAIADAFVRGREVARLAIQKGWPLDGDIIEGPTGTLSLEAIKTASREGE